MRRLFIPASIAVMTMSLGLFFASKDETIYDIDFTGGMKLQARFARPTSIDEVKKALDGGAVEVAIPDASAPPGAAQMKKLNAGPYGDSEVVTVGAGEIQVEMRHPLALSGSSGAKLAEREQLDAYRAYVAAVMKDRLLPPWVVERPAPYASTGDADVLKEFDGRLRFEFALEDPKSAVTAASLKAAFEKMPYFDYMSEGHRRTRMASDTVRRRIEVKDVARPAGATGDAKVFEIFWKSDKGASGTSAEMIPDDLLLDLKEYLGGPDFKSNLVARRRGEGRRGRGGPRRPVPGERPHRRGRREAHARRRAPRAAAVVRGHRRVRGVPVPLVRHGLLGGALPRARRGHRARRGVPRRPARRHRREDQPRAGRRVPDAGRLLGQRHGRDLRPHPRAPRQGAADLRRR